MDIKIIEKKTKVKIGGFSVETTLENREKDLEVFYNDFYKDKMDLLNSFSKNKKEYYKLIWQKGLNESNKYLIGQDITNELKYYIRVQKGYKNMIFNKLIYKEYKGRHCGELSNFEIIDVPIGTYAYSYFSIDFDSNKAWMDFYQTGIPKIGYRPKEENGFSYEYYSNGLHDKYELWSLVEKIV